MSEGSTKKRRRASNTERLISSVLEFADPGAHHLVVRDVLSSERASFLLRELERRHRPQALRYDGDRPASGGQSYQRSWRISTYAFTSPGTYVHSYFAATQHDGLSYDTELWRYLEESGVRRLLSEIKCAFMRAKGASEAEVEAMQISQCFLTVQPSEAEMMELDSLLQPHIDPAHLTINLHLSPLDHAGCPPDANGLLVYDGAASSSAKLVPTPAGAAVIIWAPRFSGRGTCLHTANSIPSGRRVLLCSFWKRRQTFAESGVATLELPPERLDSAFARLRESCIEALPSDGGTLGLIERLYQQRTRDGLLLEARRNRKALTRLRRQLLGGNSAAATASLDGEELMLDTVPALLRDSATATGELFFFDEELELVAEPSSDHGAAAWRRGLDLVEGALIGAGDDVELLTVLVPLSPNGGAVAVEEHGDSSHRRVFVSPGTCLVVASRLPHAPLGGAWLCLRYSSPRPIEVGNRGEVLAFAVPV